MTIIGSASVQIRALDNLFQKDVEAAVKKIKDVTVKIQADFDGSEAQKRIDTLRKEVETQRLELNASVDVKKADEDLEHLRKKHDKQEVQLQASAATTDASAQLSWVSRSRTAMIYPVIDGGALLTAKAILESLAGINTLRTLKDMFKNLATGFDTASIKAVVLSSAVMGLVSSLGWLASEAFAAGEGVAQLVGFFALAPTLIGATTTLLVANHLAWNNFSDAMSDNAKTAEKALALLPPAAREAAVETKKLWEEIKKPVQGAFWENMGTSLQDTLRVMGPALKAGLTETASTLGRFTSNALKSFEQIASNKTLDAMFANLNTGIDKMGRGIKPLMDALNTLGFVGSKYLPQLGDWLADLAIRFDNFIAKAAANGDIERWIENAKSAMEDLWRIGDATIGIFQGLTRAFNDAGAKGLDGLATSLKGVEEVMKGEVFQSQFGQIFSGMLQGAHAIKEGLADFGKTLGNMSQTLGMIFTLAGGVVKELLDGVSLIVGTEGFQTGMVNAFGSIKNAMDDLAPAFGNVGEILGDLFDIASGIFSSIPPVINNATNLVKGILDNLKGGFLDTIPVLMGFVNSLIAAFSGPILAVSKVIGDIASAFSKLPGDIQGIVMAIGLGLLLLPKFTTALSNMREGMRLAAEGSGKAQARYQWLNDVGGWARNASTDLGKAFGNLKYETAFGGLLAKEAFGDLKAAGSLAMSGFIDGVKGGISALGFVAGEIGTAFSKTGAQAADFLSRTGTAVADATKRAFAATSDFLSRTGATAVETAKRTFAQTSEFIARTGAAAAETLRQTIAPFKPYFSEFGRGISEGFKSSFGSLDTVGENFRTMGRTITGMVDTAAFNLRNLALTAGVAGGAVKFQVTDAFNAVKNSALSNMALAKAYIADFANTSKGHFTAFKDSALNNMELAKAYISSAAQSAEQSVRTAMTGIGNVGRTVADGFKAVGEQIGDMGSYVAARFEPVTRTITDTARTVAQTTSGMASELSSRVQAIGTAAADGVRTAATSMRDTVVNAARNISGNFAPVGAAFSAIAASAREGLGNARTHMGNLASGFGNIVAATGPAIQAIGNVAGAIGSVGKSGLGLAVGGLMNALGGPWGIAIMGATALLASFGAEQEKTKALVSNLSSTLDKQTGAVSMQTYKNLADVLSKTPDPFLWFKNGDSALANAGKMGQSAERFTKAIAGDPTARDEWLKFVDEYNEAMGGGQEAWEAFAKSNNLASMNAEDNISTMNQLQDVYRKHSVALNEAQQQIRDVASATGTNTVQAALLKANYDTLASSTSSASDKFNALKANLDVLTGRQMSASSAQKTYQQNLADSKKAIDELNGANKDQIKTLFDVNGAIDLTKQAGRDFYTVIEGQADSILKLGTTALDNALKNGSKAGEAQKIAIDTMTPAINGLAKQLSDLGLEQPQIDAIMQSFGLMPKDLTMALSVEGKDKSIQDIALVKLAAASFANGRYDAVLSALPKEAQDAITSTYRLASDVFAKGDYEAILKAMDSTAGGREAALAQILTYTGGDYKALLKALADRGSIATASSFIDSAAYDRTAVIRLVADAASVQSANDYIKTAGGRYAHGGITNGAGQQVFANGGFSIGKLAQNVKSFASGSEKHVAQIALGQTPFRVWAEPETGGEAYIPLGLSKRKRSKEILELVARQFGFGLFKMFADGGFSEHVQVGGTTSPAYTAAATASTQTPAAPQIHVYPSAALDEYKVGEVAARELWFQLQNK